MGGGGAKRMAFHDFIQAIKKIRKYSEKIFG
jgi:hypothetical protein